MQVNIGTPNAKQEQALLSHAKIIGYGGARGGGKSWLIRAKAKLLACNYPSIRLLIVRRTYPELINNHINILRQELANLARYNDRDKVLTFANGSTIHFRYCSNDADLLHFQGCEWHVIFFDEATQLSEYQIKQILACMRSSDDLPKRAYMTANPGGQGHEYFKRVFIDKKYSEGEHSEDYEFIQSLVTDNTVLMANQPDYIKQLEALPPKLRKAWLYGDWNILDGMFFEDFVDDESHYIDRKWTHVIEPFDIPSHWKIYRSYDFGYSKPFSCAWWAIDTDGVVYRILELYGCTDEPNTGVKWDADKQFAEIHKIEQEHPWLVGKTIEGVADPAIWGASTGESINDSAIRNQVWFSKGDNSRIQGWMQFHYRFRFDNNGYPMMYIFKNCKAFIRCCPLMMYDEHKVEDLDTSLEDHCLDDARYFLMSHPITPRLPQVAQELGDDPLNMRQDYHKNRQRVTFT